MKQKIRLALYVILLLALIQSAFAIGVSPATTKLDFEPGLSKNISIRILNNEHKDFNALIEIRGDLKDYVKLNQQSINVSANQDAAGFNVELTLPDKLDKAGSHITEIVIAEQPKETKDNAVAARAAVISQIIVNVPYPGVYVEGDLHVGESKVNENTQFALAVFNLGKSDLENVYAELSVYQNEEKIADLKTNKINILSGGRDRLIANWIPDKKGTYKVKATLFYAGQKMYFEQMFDVGGIDLVIESLSMHDFKLGQIVRTYILLTNTWNEKINNILVRANVRDSTGKIVSQLEAPAIDIDGYSAGSAIAYWDTSTIYPGKYQFDVIADYLGTETSKTFTAEVTQDQIIINGMPTGKAVNQLGFENPSAMTIIIIVLINLIVLNIILFLFLKRRPPKNEFNGKQII